MSSTGSPVSSTRCSPPSRGWARPRSPTSHRCRTPSRSPTSPGRTRSPRACPATSCWPVRRPPRTTASACRASWGRKRDDSRGSNAGGASHRGHGMSDVQLTTKDVAELSRLLAAGDVSAVDVTRAHLDRIAAEDGELGSYLHVDPDAALASAAAVDEARSGGTELGPLAGVPVALKDLVVTEGVPTTSGSKILGGWRPPYSATIATRLADAGTVLLGKTNMDEFAMGSSTENSAYKVTRNPWDPTRIPGGSSGGSSAAVAGHL